MATKKAADLDKDVQALMELQEKLSMQAGLGQMVRLCCCLLRPSVTACCLPSSQLSSVCAASTADAAADPKGQDSAAPNRAGTLTAVGPAR